MSSQSSIQTPGKIKRKFGDTDLTPDKMPLKIGKPMEDEEAETLINGTDLEFLSAAGKFLPKLLSSSEVQIIKTVPKEAVKDMLLTDDEGTKRLL